MAQETYDIAIIGGAIMGSAAAFWLSKMVGNSARIAVIEADPSYKHSSTALSVASIRQQFTTDVNVKISRYGVDFIRNSHEYFNIKNPRKTPLSFKENGYLFLSGSASTGKTLTQAVHMQRQYGAKTQLLEPETLKLKFPWLNTSDIHLASYGPQDEGWFDNMALLDGFRQTAQANGVTYIKAKVKGIEWYGAEITRLKLDNEQQIDAGVIVNAAGTFAADLMQILHEELPVEPRKRTVFMIDAPNAVHPDAPLMVCHSGFYLRPEHKQWICAIVPEGDQRCAKDDFEPDLHIFEAHLWERLYHRAPGFDAVRVVSAWAGHYAYNTLDQNAIVGRHPNWKNLYLMNGFSGHGLQQAPAIGRGIAELITTGSYQSIDLSDLSVERILSGHAFPEQAIV